MAILDDLEQAAMLIVLETPRRAGSGGYSTQSYVRRDLIAMLETALRKRGCDVDAGLAHMKAWRKQQKAESDARIAEYNARRE
jgi:hypothetical protein